MKMIIFTNHFSSIFSVFNFWLIILLFCQSEGACQSDDYRIKNAGVYASFQWSPKESLTFIPQLYYYEKDYYIEARYSYEYTNAMSFYFGKSFNGTFIGDYEIIPMAGLVAGESFCFSPGLNFEFFYKRFQASGEMQYPLDLNDKTYNFFWNWTKFQFDLNKYTGVGAGLQVLKPYGDKISVNIGPMLRFQYRSFAIETFVYEILSKNPYWIFAFVYDYEDPS